MKKKEGLSPNQEKLLSILEFKEKVFVTRKEIEEYIWDHIKVKDRNKLIYGMIKKQRLIKIMRNKYVVVPIRAINKDWAPNELEIVNFLMENNKYYFGLGTAFNLHNFSNQIPVKLIIFNSKYSFDKKILNNSFKFIKIKKSRLFGFSNTKFPISDKERTIIDALEYPEYLGGLDSVVDILKDLKFNQKKLEDYAIKYESIKIIKLIGFITNSSKLYHYLEKNKKLYYSSIKGLKKGDKKWKIRPI